MTKENLKDEIRGILYSDMTAAKMLEAIENLLDDDDVEDD